MRTRAFALALASLLAACSPDMDSGEPTPDASADAAVDATTDAGVACLVCGDATEDLPLAVAVRGEIDRVCSEADNCHGSGAGGMGLAPTHEFESMIDVTSYENPPMKRVLPGDPAQSYVYLKLACEGGIVGDCMPNYATHSDALARLFHDWIEAGAPTE
ncbi:MAG TPA: hypothetical protein VGL81_13745 [Polyangiaceae bacterium]